MTFYYEVWVASQRYHKPVPLTYQFDQSLDTGSLVSVPLQSQTVMAVVVRPVTKPPFTTKSILKYFDLPVLPHHLLELIEWLQAYYPAPSGIIVQQFLPKQLPDHLLDAPLAPVVAQTETKLPPLTPEQQQAVKAITEKNGSFLIHGETGSGKTRVYQEAIKEVLGQAKSAIVLTPEISLTVQLVKSLQQTVTAPVIVMHSQLSDVERRLAWIKVLTAKQPVVVVGARSALFAPLLELGLIIVDEAHEPAYKQEQSPHYQTLRVAGKLAQLTAAKLVLGSATPTLAEYYWAEQKNVSMLRMEHSPSAAAKRSLEVIDLKDKSLFNRSRYLADSLVQAIAVRLDRHEQSLLFLNRRGSARLVMCQTCGWQALCPNCDIPLIYHADSHRMICHLCNYSQPTVSVCPICQSADILFKGLGTKALIDEVNRLFPQARTQRFDSDNKKAERFESHYERVLAGEVDILVGTQTLAKGLDLPRLSLVGVIAADTGLYSPDYTASERLYQLISQVIGRVGRGHMPGLAIIQTYQPDNPILKAALSKDWPTFYNLELAERQQFLYPPFCHLLKLSCQRASLSSVHQATDQLMERLNQAALKINIVGPAPAFYEKAGNNYNWQIVVKSKDRQDLLKVIALLPSGWSYDIDPTNLL